jgi:CelD/BcsL family acetyltransferase involved in cellulose biosynthesis
MNCDTQRTGTTHAALSVEEINSYGELRSLRDEMDALWRADSDATVFQSPGWLFAWLEHINQEERLMALVVRSNGLMVGFAPFCLHTTREGVSQLSLIAAGISDYLDIVVHTGYREQVAATLFHYLCSRAGWDVLNLEQLRPRSALLRHPVALDETVEAQDVCPVLPLSSSSDLDAAVRAPALRQLAYYRRRMARTVRASIERADDTNLESMVDSLAILHRRRWAVRGEGGVLSDGRVIAFHRGVAEGLARDGMLRMYLLKFDGNDAAAFYGFHHYGRTIYYLGGFAPEFARLNPGAIIVGHAIEMALAEGAAEFDFLRGSEPYKFFWGARARINYRRIIQRNHGPLHALDHDINS